MHTRQTFQKSLTLEAVKEMQCHPTADRVYDYVCRKYPEISRATIYRNLNRLSEAGLIGRVKNPYGADRFDHIPQKHHHFICTKCGSIYNVTIPDVSTLEDTCTQQLGCKVEEDQIFFSGVCKDCLE